jgi:sporulation protein YlmC with PRC-barrel domain
MMKKFFTVLGLMMVLSIFAVAPSFAAPKGTMNMLGKTVENDKGQKVGTVWDLVVNREGQIESVVLDRDGVINSMPYKEFKEKGYVVTGSVSPRSARIENMLGKRVVNKEGENIGTVYDMVVNDDGKIQFVVVSKKGEATAIPYKYFKKGPKGAMTANVEKLKIEKAPHYNVKKGPLNYDPNWDKEQFGYWK